MSLRNSAGWPRPVGLRRSSPVARPRVKTAMAVTDARMTPASRAAGVDPRRAGATAACSLTVGRVRVNGLPDLDRDFRAMDQWYPQFALIRIPPGQPHWSGAIK